MADSKPFRSGAQGSSSPDMKNTGRFRRTDVFSLYAASIRFSSAR